VLGTVLVYLILRWYPTIASRAPAGTHPHRSARAQAVPDATEPGLQVVSTGLTSP